MPALPERPQHLRVGQRAVAFVDADGVAREQCVEAVPVMLGKELARELDGAQAGRAEVDAQALEFALEEGVVEARVMRDEQATAQFLEHLRGDLLKARRAGDHRRVDSGQPGDEGGDRDARIDQRTPFAYAVLVDRDEADLDDAIVGEIARWSPGRQIRGVLEPG